jgi:hypothetical protein
LGIADGKTPFHFGTCPPYQPTIEDYVMKQKLVLILAGVAVAAGLSISPVHAVTPGAIEANAGTSLVEKTHFRHRSCERGPYGWHRHRGYAGWRVACWPRARYPHRCWIDRFGYRHCWW